MTRETRTRRIAGNILIFLPGLILVMSSILKFAGVTDVVRQMDAAGFTDGKRLLVAALEMVSAVLFLYPRARSFGLLLLSSFLGGAICTHVQMGEFPKAFPPAILLVFAWIGVGLLHPEMLWSFKQSVALRTNDEEKGHSRLASREA